MNSRRNGRMDYIYVMGVLAIAAVPVSISAVVSAFLGELRRAAVQGAMAAALVGGMFLLRLFRDKF